MGLRRNGKRLGTVAAAALILAAAASGHGGPSRTAGDAGGSGAYQWHLPEGFPVPVVPADNPMTEEKVALGRRLFFDARLSGDGTVSCATCHRPDLAFTDGKALAEGIGGSRHPRSAMSLTNVVYNATLGWDDPGLNRLEDQMLVPLLSTRPPEMGAAGHEQWILARLKADRDISRLFRDAFPGRDDPITLRTVVLAVASFERTLISGDTPYDRWAYGGQPDALSADERAGARLFFSSRLSCFACHAGFNFSGPVVYEGSGVPAALFHNTALYNADTRGAYPEPNTGVHRHTGLAADMGKFRAPTLRNIALTAPYMHDGSVPTLAAVIDHYAAGGRARHIGGDAATDPLMTGFTLTAEDRRQLIAFLNALTDASFAEKALVRSGR